MKKTFVLVLALVLAVSCVVGGTLAYLFDTSETVTNTFTVGDINISLAETVANEFKIIPGATDAKDPVLTVKKGSEKCYVYVTIENTVKIDGTVVAVPNLNASDWILVKTESDKTLYRYKDVVDAMNADVELSVFTSVKYSDTIRKEDIAALTDTKIELKGYAHQSQEVDQDVADAAATAWAFPTN